MAEILKVCYNNGYYIGEMHNRSKEGQGTFVFKNGNKYRGSYSHDVYEGFGVFDFANGERFEGNYVNDKQEGKGIYYSVTGEKYEGLFRDGKPNGKGYMLFSDGDIAEVEYSAGEIISEKTVDTLNGSNMLNYFSTEYVIKEIEYSDGSSYLGEIVNGERHGYGKYTDKNGNTYKGIFKNNKRNGVGEVYFTKSGKTCIVEYKDNKQIHIKQYEEDNLHIDEDRKLMNVLTTVKMAVVPVFSLICICAFVSFLSMGSINILEGMYRGGDLIKSILAISIIVVYMVLMLMICKKIVNGANEKLKGTFGKKKSAPMITMNVICVIILLLIVAVACGLSKKLFIDDIVCRFLYCGIFDGTDEGYLAFYNTFITNKCGTLMFGINVAHIFRYLFLVSLLIPYDAMRRVMIDMQQDQCPHCGRIASVDKVYTGKFLLSTIFMTKKPYDMFSFCYWCKERIDKKEDDISDNNIQATDPEPSKIVITRGNNKEDADSIQPKEREITPSDMADKKTVVIPKSLDDTYYVKTTKQNDDESSAVEKEETHAESESEKVEREESKAQLSKLYESVQEKDDVKETEKPVESGNEEKSVFFTVDDE